MTELPGGQFFICNFEQMLFILQMPCAAIFAPNERHGYASHGPQIGEYRCSRDTSFFSYRCFNLVACDISVSIRIECEEYPVSNARFILDSIYMDIERILGNM